MEVATAELETVEPELETVKAELETLAKRIRKMLEATTKNQFEVGERLVEYRKLTAEIAEDGQPLSYDQIAKEIDAKGYGRSSVARYGQVTEFWTAEGRSINPSWSFDRHFKELGKLAKAKRQKAEQERLAEIAVNYEPSDRIDIRIGDCEEQTNNIADNSIDAIITDYPYGEQLVVDGPRVSLEQTLALAERCARIAARILKPSGFFVTYTGHVNLPKFMDVLQRHLTYWHMIPLIHANDEGKYNSGGLRLDSYNLICRYKTILVYQKPPFKGIRRMAANIINDDTPPAQLAHRWEQGLDGTKKLVEMFSDIDDTVVDLAAGSGTTLVSCQALGRKAIGIDIDPQHLETIKGRLFCGR